MTTYYDEHVNPFVRSGAATEDQQPICPACWYVIQAEQWETFGLIESTEWTCQGGHRVEPTYSVLAWTILTPRGDFETVGAAHYGEVAGDPAYNG